MEVIREPWELVNFSHYVALGDQTQVVWFQLSCQPLNLFLNVQSYFTDAHICHYSCSSWPTLLLASQVFLALRNLCLFFPNIYLSYCVSLEITYKLQNIYLHFWKICVLEREFIKFIYHLGQYCHFNECFHSMNIGFIELLLVLTMIYYFQNISLHFCDLNYFKCLSLRMLLYIELFSLFWVSKASIFQTF